MRARNDRSVRSFVLGVLLGAGLGVLLAPASGSETRARLRHEMQRASSSVRRVGETIDRDGRKVMRDTADRLDRIAHR
jgi:gas vesicle protein